MKKNVTKALSVILVLAMLLAYGGVAGAVAPAAGSKAVAGYAAPADESADEAADITDEPTDEPVDEPVSESASEAEDAPVIDGETVFEPVEDQPAEDENTDDNLIEEITPPDDSEDKVDEQPNEDDSSAEDPSLGGVQIITPDVEEDDGRQAFLDYLDYIRTWDFTDVNVHLAIATTGFYQILDSQGFGYDEETEQYYAFDEMSLEQIWNKVLAMGIDSMDVLASWIEDVWANTPEFISVFEQNYGTHNKGTSPTTFTIAIANGDSGSAHYTTSLGKTSETFDKENGNAVKDITITPNSGYKISAIDVNNGSTSNPSLVAIYKKTGESGTATGGTITNLLDAYTPDKDGKITIKAEDMTRTVDGYKSGNPGTLWFRNNGLTETITDDGSDDPTNPDSGTITVYGSFLSLTVHTDRVAVSSDIAITEVGNDDAAVATYSLTTPSASFQGLTAERLQSQLVGDNGLLSKALRGDEFHIDFDSNRIAGVGVKGGNDVTVSEGSVSFKAGDEGLKLAFVYQPTITALNITDGKEDKKENKDFFGEYLNSCSCVINGKQYGPHNDYEAMQNAIQGLLRTGSTITSMTFDFKKSYRIRSANYGHSNDGKTLNDIEVNAKTYSKYDTPSKGEVQNAIKGTWSENTFTPDDAEALKKSNEATLEITLVDNSPVLTLAHFDAQDRIGQPGEIIIAIAENPGGNGTWSPNASISLHGTISCDPENPQSGDYTDEYMQDTPLMPIGGSRSNYYGYKFIPKDGHDINYQYTVNVTAVLSNGDYHAEKTAEIKVGKDHDAFTDSVSGTD